MFQGHVAADRAELEKEIHSTGFFRNKAKAIIGAARRIVEVYGGVVPELASRAHLATIQPVTRRALEQAGLTGRERESAEAIVTGAQRMNAMIQDLVDSARLESGQLKLEDVSGGEAGFYYYLTFRRTQTQEGSRFYQYASRTTGCPTVDGKQGRENHAESCHE